MTWHVTNKYWKMGVKELNVGKKAIIITERKEHIDSLNQYMKQSYKTIINPEDFSRIVHDYFNKLKGFIILNDLLVSCLV